MSTSLPCLTESQEADTLVAYLRLRGIRFTHIGNESTSGMEAARRGRRMKQAGQSPGFPDYVIVLPGVGLACIELKRLRGSKTSPEQLEWIEALNSCPGVEARVCKGASAAIEFIEELLPLPTLDKQVAADTLQF